MMICADSHDVTFSPPQPSPHRMKTVDSYRIIFPMIKKGRLIRFVSKAFKTSHCVGRAAFVSEMSKIQEHFCQEENNQSTLELIPFIFPQNCNSYQKPSHEPLKCGFKTFNLDCTRKSVTVNFLHDCVCVCFSVKFLLLPQRRLPNVELTAEV